METWYQIGGYGNDPIKSVEITRSTENFVTLAGSGRRAAKKSSYLSYYESFEDAVQILRSRMVINIEASKRNIASRELKLEKFDDWLKEQK